MRMQFLSLCKMINLVSECCNKPFPKNVTCKGIPQSHDTKIASFMVNRHSMQNSLRSLLKFSSPPQPQICLGPPPSIESPTSHISIFCKPTYCLFLFVCMFVKNQLNQSFIVIIHRLPYQLVSCILSCWLIKLSIQDIHKNTFNSFIFFLCRSILGGTTVLYILSSW